jgi:hypothetical protein
VCGTTTLAWLYLVFTLLPLTQILVNGACDHVVLSSGHDRVACACDGMQEADPTEHHDLAAQTPDVVQTLKARLEELGKSEVTVEASGLCPTSYGSHSDPRCRAKANETGFWEPWLNNYEQRKPSL